MFVMAATNDDVNEYNLSTGFDVSTASFVDAFDVSNEESDPTGLAFNRNGTRLFVIGKGDNGIHEYTLSTGFDVSTATFVASLSVNSTDGSASGIRFNDDGTKMFFVGFANDSVYEHTIYFTASFLSRKETEYLLALNRDKDLFGSSIKIAKPLGPFNLGFQLENDLFSQKNNNLNLSLSTLF